MRKTLTILLAITMLASLSALAGCSAKISDIRSNTDDYLGKQITISGTVKNTLKIGQLSGFTLVQGEDSIPVASDELPKEGDKVTVKGTINTGLLGLYFQAADVR